MEQRIWLIGKILAGGVHRGVQSAGREVDVEQSIVIEIEKRGAPTDRVLPRDFTPTNAGSGSLVLEFLSATVAIEDTFTHVCYKHIQPAVTIVVAHSQAHAVNRGVDPCLGAHVVGRPGVSRWAGVAVKEVGPDELAKVVHYVKIWPAVIIVVEETDREAGTVDGRWA